MCVPTVISYNVFFFFTVDQINAEVAALADSRLPDRDSRDWDHLRAPAGLNELLKSENLAKTIKLPNLVELPKELREDTLATIILTPQRVQILKQFRDAMRIGVRDIKGEEEAGIILSGANGVGKTVESYLLACVAYVNNCILTYIVRTFVEPCMHVPLLSALFLCSLHLVSLFAYARC